MHSLTYGASGGDAGSFAQDLLKGSGHYDQISQDGFFSLVLNNRGNYHAFVVSVFTQARDWANGENLDINTPYDNAMNAGKNHCQTLKDILQPHGIRVLINYTPPQP